MERLKLGALVFWLKSVLGLCMRRGCWRRATIAVVFRDDQGREAGRDMCLGCATELLDDEDLVLVEVGF